MDKARVAVASGAKDPLPRPHPRPATRQPFASDLNHTHHLPFARGVLSKGSLRTEPSVLHVRVAARGPTTLPRSSSRTPPPTAPSGSSERTMNQRGGPPLSSSTRLTPTRTSGRSRRSPRTGWSTTTGCSIPKSRGERGRFEVCGSVVAWWLLLVVTDLRTRLGRQHARSTTPPTASIHTYSLFYRVSFFSFPPTDSPSNGIIATCFVVFQLSHLVFCSRFCSALVSLFSNCLPRFHILPHSVSMLDYSLSVTLLRFLPPSCSTVISCEDALPLYTTVINEYHIRIEGILVLQ